MTGMAGALRLVVGLDGAGRCALREQYNSQLHRVLRMIPGDAPEEGLLYVLNPTGGVLQGDRLDADVRVERGAHAVITSPSATKIYRADRFSAESHTRLRVAEGAILEYLPEPLIPYSGSRFVEHLVQEVEAGGRLLSWEILAPGRAARGELFDYELLGLRLEVREGDSTVLRERADLRPSREPFPALAFGEGTHYGVLVAIGGDVQQLTDAIRDDCGSLRAGVSALRGTGLIVKSVAGGLAEIHGLFHRVRDRVLSRWTGRPATVLRTT
jgi:urease accessory protein